MVVQKGNKQLRIPEEAKDMYLSLGYSVIDEEGEIVEAGHATDLAAIKAENNTLKSKLSEYQENAEKLEKVAELEAKVAEYEKANADLSAQLEAATKKSK
jgi:cell shape-determining protein MreC